MFQMIKCGRSFVSEAQNSDTVIGIPGIPPLIGADQQYPGVSYRAGE